MQYLEVECPVDIRVGGEYRGRQGGEVETVVESTFEIPLNPLVKGQVIRDIGKSGACQHVVL